jgi:hypothetical protein
VISKAIADGRDVGVAKLNSTATVICPSAAVYVLGHVVTLTDWAEAKPTKALAKQSNAVSLFIAEGTRADFMMKSKGWNFFGVERFGNTGRASLGW